MSSDPSVPPPPAEAIVAPAAPPPEEPTQPMAPPVPSGPYRMPETPEATPAYDGSTQFAPRSRPWPTIGPAFSVFAVLLWSFVVAGQLTTSWLTGAPLPNSTALGFVFLATFAMWIVGIRRSRLAMPPRTAAHLVGRAVAIALLGFGLFGACIFVAMIAGEIARNHDFAIAFGLVLFATVAAIAGPRWTWPTRPEPTQRQRVTWVLFWIAGMVLTVIAGAELAING